MRLIDGNKIVMSLGDWWYSSFGQEETEESKAIKKVMEQVEKMVMEEKHQMREYIPKDEVLDIIKSMPMDLVEEYVYELDGIWLVDDEEKIQLSPETSTNDLISRQAAGETFCALCNGKRFGECEYSNTCQSLRALQSVPPVEPKPKEGEWIACTKEGLPLTELMRREGKKWYGYRCTNCSFIYKGNALTESRYCQGCGAKMGGDTECTR